MYNILLTSIGRRVQLIKHLKKSFRVIGIDANIYNAASKFVDAFYKVPRYDEDNYIDSIIEICKKENINLLVPLYEKEFISLCTQREELNTFNVKLLLSDSRVVAICNNKLNTYKFFNNNNILAPKTYSKTDAMINLDYPVIVKPIDGMGSENIYIAKNKDEMNFFINYIENPIIQKFICGTEYTIDVLCNFDGDIISIVPRQRIEVRSGEVSKSRTIKNKNIISKTKELIEALNKEGNVIGPITVQCILNNENIYFIEINCRFGGGVPLTFEAGVNYGYYLSEMIEGKKQKSIIGDFKEVIMLRYDESIFI